MRSRPVRRPALAIAILGSALLSAACFGGGGQPAAQATPTSPSAAATTAPSPAASPPAAAKPAVALPSPAASPSPIRPNGTEESYTVEPGDTLAVIAQKFYGDPTQWRKIYDANRAAIGDNPDAIKVGTQLKIPPKE
jgi:nucleoid-associated protein YgaU